MKTPLASCQMVPSAAAVGDQQYDATRQRSKCPQAQRSASAEPPQTTALRAALVESEADVAASRLIEASDILDALRKP